MIWGLSRQVDADAAQDDKADRETDDGSACALPNRGQHGSRFKLGPSLAQNLGPGTAYLRCK